MTQNPIFLQQRHFGQDLSRSLFSGLLNTLMILTWTRKSRNFCLPYSYHFFIFFLDRWWPFSNSWRTASPKGNKAFWNNFIIDNNSRVNLTFQKLEPAPWQEHQQKTQEPAKQEASPWGQQDPWSAPAKAESSSDGWSAPAKAESYSDGWSAPAKAESSSDGWSSQSQPKTNQGGWGVTPSSSFAPWNKSISQQKVCLL